MLQPSLPCRFDESRQDTAVLCPLTIPGVTESARPLTPIQRKLVQRLFASESDLDKDRLLTEGDAGIPVIAQMYQSRRVRTHEEKARIRSFRMVNAD